MHTPVKEHKLKSESRLLLTLWVCVSVLPLAAESTHISCLGRIEPLGGVVVLAGPSGEMGGTG